MVSAAVVTAANGRMRGSCKAARRRVNAPGHGSRRVTSMNDRQPTVPYGYCHCGCGEKTRLSPYTAHARGYVKGEPRRYIAGHENRGAPHRNRDVAIRRLHAEWAAAGIEYGLCLCGCGTPTKLAPRNDKRFGQVAGEPVRHARGHQVRSEHPYVVEDCGYSSPCWLCTRWRHPVTGYAQLCDGTGKGRVAHVVMWERVNGPVPEGMQLDHLCTIRHCINPAHLEPVTGAENVRRSRAAKLTSADVLAIRALIGGGWVLEDIGRAFGVSGSTVQSIRAGRVWSVDAG
jgi:hypothetical protein